MSYEESSHSALMSINHHQLTKSIQTLLGICTGISADNNLNDQEILFLSLWIKENPETTQIWPGSIIADRVSKILSDGVISTHEREDLLDTLNKLIGNYFSETGSAKNEITSIDYCIDKEIYFKDKIFCFTGEFVLGTRAVCKRLLDKIGGISVDNISKKLDYLVVGTLISDEWAYTSYGRKIEKAMQLRDALSRPGVISEKQWTDALKKHIVNLRQTIDIIPEDCRLEQNIYLNLR